MNQNVKAEKKDVFNASAITSIVLSLLNTFVDNNADENAIKPYLNDLVLSALSSLIAIMASPYLILKRQRHYNECHVKNTDNKLKVLNDLLLSSSDEEEKKELKASMIELRKQLANNVIKEKAPK